LSRSQAAYYPVYLSLAERLVVVIGGGSIAERKVAGLLPSGARVRVVALELTPELARLAGSGEIEHRARDYRPGDLEGAFLALAEPGGAVRDEAFSTEAEARGIFANVEDVVECCSFIAPSIVRRGDLVIAIDLRPGAGPGGSSPAATRAGVGTGVRGATGTRRPFSGTPGTSGTRVRGTAAPLV